MAKSTNGGTTKGTTKSANGESKARRAPARQKSVKKNAEAPIVVASDVAGPDMVAVSQAASLAAAPPELVRPFDTRDLNPDEVRRRAYELYIGRGCTNGCDVDDWLEAERQLRGSRTH